MEAIERINPRRTVMDGIPTFWAEAPGPYTGALIFRTGKADETLATSGLSHVVEHLALFPLDRLPYAHNGLVDDTRTIFHASGTAAEVAGFLTAVCRNLSALPFQRLEDELRVLRAEDASQPGAHALWGWRFGPCGYGLVSFAEIGLHWLDAERIDEWRRSRFTRGNCAMWFTGEPPEGLELDLPDGERILPPEPKRIESLDLPTYTNTDEAGISASFMLDRSVAAGTALGLLAERTQEHLRRDRGLTYGVGSSYWRLTADDAHAMVGADSTPGHATAVRDGLFRVFDELASDGPPPGELDRRLELAERYVGTPDGLQRDLDTWASNELTGKTTISSDDLLTEMRALQPSDISSTLARAADEMMLSVPFGVSLGSGRASLYGSNWDDEAVEGRAFEMKDLDRGAGAKLEIVIGERGVSQVVPGQPPLTVLYETCVLVAFEGDHGVTVMDSRGVRIGIQFGSEETREEILDCIRPHVSADVIAEVDRDVRARAEQVRDLAAERLSGEPRLRELNLLARFMFEGEAALDLAHGEFRGTRGLLAISDLRVMLVSADTGQMHAEVVREQIQDAEGRRGLRRGGLTIRLTGGDVELTGISPAGRATEMAERLRGQPT